MKTLQLKVFFLFLLLAAAMPLFAQNTRLVPAGLTTMAESIREVFTGPIVRIILVCCLAGCGVAYGFNKDNEKMKRNVIAIAVALVIIACASGIVEAIWGASGGPS
jgi:type IV secretory pathway VirB2 component (pilin)